MQVCKTPVAKSVRAFIAKQFSSNTVSTVIHNTQRNNMIDTNMDSKVNLTLSTEKSSESADLEYATRVNDEKCVTSDDDEQVLNSS